jgi:hypothetical protein
MDVPTLLPVLLSWAAHLSHYPMPEEMPQIVFEPHAFFVERVCAGKECNAVGWYNDEHIIYIDEKYRLDDDSFATSLVVHELTHYLQHLSGRFDSPFCADSLQREREAYEVQNDYIVSGQGSFDIVHPGRPRASTQRRMTWRDRLRQGRQRAQLALCARSARRLDDELHSS